MNLIPKYFKDLHLMVSSITGQPRIVKVDKSKPNFSDKYIDIPKEEFESAVLNYFAHYKESTKWLAVTEDWSFCVGGNVKDKEQLIKALEDAIKEVKGLE